MISEEDRAEEVVLDLLSTAATRERERRRSLAIIESPPRNLDRSFGASLVEARDSVMAYRRDGSEEREREGK
ncbi:hypothetical protein TIFTF001_022365 [Ficus carica]|uniref:Uncharacterized protein n=1 Tax=Ficus carica TaxID=3494 RepID=A0AA88DEG0_FICCA|nr:hypothetical protein TIFTF001_022365 [Ficus carica]